VYGFALEDHGIDYVLRKVGVEPTGEAFNSIVFDEKHNRPFNPMVNAGAIATTALIKGTGHDDRLARLLDKLSNLAGRSLDIDHSVYISERSTGHRNRAIGYPELNFGMLDDPVLNISIFTSSSVQSWSARAISPSWPQLSPTTASIRLPANALWTSAT
jgi:glutaminase